MQTTTNVDQLDNETFEPLGKEWVKRNGFARVRLLDETVQTVNHHQIQVQ